MTQKETSKCAGIREEIEDIMIIHFLLLFFLYSPSFYTSDIHSIPVPAWGGVLEVGLVEYDPSVAIRYGKCRVTIYGRVSYNVPCPLPSCLDPLYCSVTPFNSQITFTGSASGLAVTPVRMDS